MDARVARAPEDGVMGGGAPCALNHRKEMPASSRGWLGPGWAGGKDSPDTAQTLQCIHKPLSQAWDGNMDKNTHGTQHSRADRVSVSTETYKQSRSYSILSPQDSSERNRPGCLSLKRYSFCCCCCCCFHRNLSQQHYHLRYFRERKQWSPKNKSHPLAGRAGSRIWETSLHQ